VNLDEFERRKRIKSAKERAKNKPVPKARQRGRSPKLRRYIENLKQFGDYTPPTGDEEDAG
jgi:hypothetical protein